MTSKKDTPKHEPKPLFFRNDAEPVAWVCGKCGWLTNNRAMREANQLARLEGWRRARR